MKNKVYLIKILFLLNFANCYPINKIDISFTSLIKSLNSCNNIEEFDLKYNDILNNNKKIKRNDSLYYEILKTRIDFYQRNFKFKAVLKDIIFLKNSKNLYFKAIGQSRYALDLMNSSNTKFALEYFLNAKDYFLKINSEFELAVIYNNIGNLYIVNNKYEIAINYYLKTLIILKKYDKVKELQYGLTLNNLSQAYFQINDLDKAFYYHKLFKEILSYTNFEVLKFMYLINNSNFFSYSNSNIARESLSQAKEIVFKSNNNFYLGSYYCSLAINEFYDKNYQNSLKYIDLALDFFKKVNALYYYKRTLIVKKYILYQIKNYKELTVLYETVDSVNNVIDDYQIDSVIQEAEIKYKNLEKSKKILLLESIQKSHESFVILLISLIIIAFLLVFLLLHRIKKIKIEKLHQNVLSKLLILQKINETERNEQNRIANELHNLIGAQLLILRLYIQDSNCYDKALLKIDDISEKLRLISHNLFKNDFTKQNFISLVEDFVHNIIHSSHINIDLYIDEFYNSLNDSLKLFLYKTIQELVSNSIKHGNAKIVIINLHKQVDNYLYIVIEDVGNGFDAKKDITNGIGLKSIEEVIKSIDGQMLIESQINIGTTISIRFDFEKFKDFKNV